MLGTYTSAPACRWNLTVFSTCEFAGFNKCITESKIFQYEPIFVAQNRLACFLPCFCHLLRFEVLSVTCLHTIWLWLLPASGFTHTDAPTHKCCFICIFQDRWKCSSRHVKMSNHKYNLCCRWCKYQVDVRGKLTLKVRQRRKSPHEFILMCFREFQALSFPQQFFFSFSFDIKSF